MRDGDAIIKALEDDMKILLEESNNRHNRPALKRQYALLYSGVKRSLAIALRATGAPQ